MRNGRDLEGRRVTERIGRKRCEGRWRTEANRLRKRAESGERDERKWGL